MVTEIGSTSTTKSPNLATAHLPDVSAAFVHNMGAGIMASITAMSSLFGLPISDVSNLDEPRTLEAPQPYETVIFQGWTPRFSAVANRLPSTKRVLAH